MEEPRTAIILFAHGSAVDEANQQVAKLAAEVAQRAGCPAGCAFLEIAQPDMAAAVTGFVKAGMRRIVVVPYFLTMGTHMRRDLPRLIELQRAQFPDVEILTGLPLEGSPEMAGLILQRVREATQRASS